jgi:hypothetical protein
MFLLTILGELFSTNLQVASVWFHNPKSGIYLNSVFLFFFKESLTMAYGLSLTLFADKINTLVVNQ